MRILAWYILLPLQYNKMESNLLFRAAVSVIALLLIKQRNDKHMLSVIATSSLLLTNLVPPYAFSVQWISTYVVFLWHFIFPASFCSLNLWLFSPPVWLCTALYRSVFSLCLWLNDCNFSLGHADSTICLFISLIDYVPHTYISHISALTMLVVEN